MRIFYIIPPLVGRRSAGLSRSSNAMLDMTNELTRSSSAPIFSSRVLDSVTRAAIGLMVLLSLPISVALIPVNVSKSFLMLSSFSLNSTDVCTKPITESVGYTL